MAPPTSDLYDIAGPVPCHGLATMAIPTLSAPPMTRRAAATAYRTEAPLDMRPRINKSNIHRQMGLAFRKFDELGDILEASTEKIFYAPTAQGRGVNRPSKKLGTKRNQRQRHQVEWPSFGVLKPAGEEWIRRLEKAEVGACKAEREAGELKEQLKQVQGQVADHRLQVQAMRKECGARRRGAQGQGEQVHDA